MLNTNGIKHKKTYYINCSTWASIIPENMKICQADVHVPNVIDEIIIRNTIVNLEIYRNHIDNTYTQHNIYKIVVSTM